MKKIPSLEEIKKEYDEIILLLKTIKSKKDALEISKKYHVTIEINNDFVENYNENNPIEYIRCEAWKTLGYIYYYFDDRKPMFDVWNEFTYDYFIVDTTIETLEKEYEKGIKWLYNEVKNYNYNMNFFISLLREANIQYNDMIDVYGIDVNIVEEYKNNHYELGYGDY